MDPYSASIELRSKIFFDGQWHVVAGFSGTDLRLETSRGEIQLVALDTVRAFPDFRLDAPDGNGEVKHDLEALAELSTFFETLPARARKKALKKREHMFDVFPDLRPPSEDTRMFAPEYDPATTTVEDRVQAKIRQTKWGRRRIFYYRSEYLRLGTWGLVDGRTVRKSGASLDPRVIATIEEILDEEVNKSRKTIAYHYEQVADRLRMRHGDEVSMPTLSTFRRHWPQIIRGRAWDGPTKYRRSRAQGPEKPYGHFRADRPGQLVLLDSSPYDLFAVDEVSARWIALEWTVAWDVCSHSVFAFVLTPRAGTKGIDAAQLLREMLRPKCMQPGYPDAARWPFSGIPETMILAACQPHDPKLQLAGFPYIVPDRVLADRNRIFLSQTYQDGCARLSISPVRARPGTPTDKAPLERFFRTAREALIERLPAYKGPDVNSRGKRPEDEAILTIDELHSLIGEWIIRWWQVRAEPDNGLFLPDNPKIPVSPNRMYEEGVMRWGLPRVPMTANVYYELLPTEWRTIQHYGVERDYLIYDDPVLNKLRDQRSTHTVGNHSGKWPIKYDPRDLSKVFFRHPDTGIWHTLRWIHAAGEDRPFNDLTLAYAKEVLKGRGALAKTHDQLSRVLNEIVTRFQLEEIRDPKERRLRLGQRMHDQQVKRDKAGVWKPELDPADGAEVRDSEGSAFSYDEVDIEGIEPRGRFRPDEETDDFPEAA